MQLCIDLMGHYFLRDKCFLGRNVKFAHGNKAARASVNADKKEEQPQQQQQQQQQLRHKRWSKKCMSIRNINVRTAAHYMPTDNDISQLLKAFTVDFLLNGTPWSRPWFPFDLKRDRSTIVKAL